MAALQVQLLSVEYPCVTSSIARCVLWLRYITVVSIYYNHGYSIPNTRRNCNVPSCFSSRTVDQNRSCAFKKRSPAIQRIETSCKNSTLRVLEATVLVALVSHGPLGPSTEFTTLSATGQLEELRLP